MGLALEFEMTDFYGNDFRFRVYDDNYAGSTITPEMNDFSLVYTPSGDDLLCPIITSELTLDFWDQGETGLAARITSIEESEEPEIRITMELDSGSGYEFWWAGIVEKESIVRYNNPQPRRYTLRASDGISRLKDIRYIGTDGKSAPYQVTPAQVILECLALSGLDDFWGASDPYFRESIEWVSNDVTTPSSADSPLLYTRYSILHYRDKVNDTEFTWKSAWDVMEATLKLYGAQLLHANGSYYIRQPRNFEGTTHTERRINKLLSSVSASTVDNDVEAVSASTKATAGYFNVLAGGEFGRVDPLDKVRAIIEPRVAVNYTGKDQDIIKTGDLDANWTVPLGTIRGGTGKTFRVAWKHKVAKKGKWEWRATITITLPGTPTYYLKLDSATNDETWETTPSNYQLIRKPDRDGDVTIAFTVNEDIPSGTYSNCTAQFDFEYWDRKTGAQPSGGVGDQWILVFHPDILLIDEANNGVRREVEVDNPLTSGNSRVLDLGELWLNDEAVISSYNTFEINESGASWVDPTTWDAGFDTDTNLAESALIERMSYQRSPVELYRGMLDGFARPHLSIVYDSKTWCMRRYEWQGKLGRANGEWWELIHATTSITIGDERTTDYPDDIIRTKPPVQWDTFDDRHYKFERIGELGAEYLVSGGAITSISLLNQIGHGNVRDGDTITIVHPLTGDTLDEFEVSADAASSATSISIASATPTYDLGVGYNIMFKRFDMVSADNVRGEFMRFMDTHSDASAPPSSLYQSSTLGGLAFKDSGGTSSLVGGSSSGSAKSTTNISSAEILALSGSPQTLIAAPGAGKYLRVIDAYIDYNHVTTDYAGSSTWIIEYSGGQHIAYHATGATRTTSDYLNYTSTDTSAVSATPHAITWGTKVNDGIGAKQTDGDTSRIDIEQGGTYTLSAAVAVYSDISQRPQMACEIYINGVGTGIIRGSSYIRNLGVSWDWWIIEIAATKLELEAGDYVQLYVYQVETTTYGAGGTSTVNLHGDDKTFINLERNNVPMASSSVLLGSTDGQAKFAVVPSWFGGLPINESLRLTCDTDLTTGAGNADVVVLYETVTI